MRARRRRHRLSRGDHAGWLGCISRSSLYARSIARPRLPRSGSATSRRFPGVKVTSKTPAPGNFFEDYRIGQTLPPRGAAHGDRGRPGALHRALSDAASRSPPRTSSPAPAACRAARSTISPPSTSSSARPCPTSASTPSRTSAMPRRGSCAPVYPGDTLTATSEVIGLRETSNGRSGVVWVRIDRLEPARRGGARLLPLGDGAQARRGGAGTAAGGAGAGAGGGGRRSGGAGGARLHAATTSRWPASRIAGATMRSASGSTTSTG